MFEAREFLRKKLIGQSVQVTVDYIQQANEEFPEKTWCQFYSTSTLRRRRQSKMGERF
jgi:hypothetical protein